MAINYFAPLQQAMQGATDVSDKGLATAYKMHEFETDQKIKKLALDEAKIKLDDLKRKTELEQLYRQGAANAQGVANPAHAAYLQAHTPEALAVAQGKPPQIWSDAMNGGAGDYIPDEAKIAQGQAQLAVANAPAPPQMQAPSQFDRMQAGLQEVMKVDPIAAEQYATGMFERLKKMAPEGTDPQEINAVFNKMVGQPLFGRDFNYVGGKDEFMTVPEGSTVIKRKTGEEVFTNPKTDTKETWSEPFKMNVGGRVALVQQSSHGQLRPVIQDAPQVRVEMNAREARNLRKDETGLRKEFLGLPEVKEYPTIEGQVMKASKTLETSLNTKSQMPVDQSIITTFNKMLDPTSVVRESEYARTPQDLAMLSRIKGKWEKIKQGGAGLTLEERQAIKRMIDTYGAIASKQYNARASEYRDLADSYGFDPNRVVSRKNALDGKPSTGFPGIDQDALAKELKRRGVK